MIYHKILMGEGHIVKAELYEDEIYYTCPSCGLEKQVDQVMLKSIVVDGCDFGGTSFHCPDCSKKHFAKQ